MFKLVQQAHEKVLTKEKEHAARIAADKKKWELELEKKLAQKMKGLQKKYDEESNQVRGATGACTATCYQPVRRHPLGASLLWARHSLT